MLTEIFYHVDNFCKEYNKTILKKDEKSNQSGRKPNLSLSEIITIAIWFHYSGYKNFKTYYLNCVCKELKNCFNKLVAYNRFVELMQESLLPLTLFSKLLSNGKCRGISFIDSFSLKACHIKRQSSNKVFKNIAKKGKTSMGWFFGFKVHFIINHLGEIVNFHITPGNVSDRNIEVIDQLTKSLFGKLIGDKGYISKKAFEMLWHKGIQLITKLAKNMKNKLMSLGDKLLLKKRGVIESAINILKNTLSIEHTRYRSPVSFLVNVCSALAAYAFKKTKPSIILKNPALLG